MGSAVLRCDVLLHLILRVYLCVCTCPALPPPPPFYLFFSTFFSTGCQVPPRDDAHIQLGSVAHAIICSVMAQCSEEEEEEIPFSTIIYKTGDDDGLVKCLQPPAARYFFLITIFLFVFWVVFLKAQPQNGKNNNKKPRERGWFFGWLVSVFVLLYTFRAVIMLLLLHATNIVDSEIISFQLYNIRCVHRGSPNVWFLGSSSEIVSVPQI